MSASEASRKSSDKDIQEQVCLSRFRALPRSAHRWKRTDLKSPECPISGRSVVSVVLREIATALRVCPGVGQGDSKSCRHWHPLRPLDLVMMIASIRCSVLEPSQASPGETVREKVCASLVPGSPACWEVGRTVLSPKTSRTSHSLLFRWSPQSLCRHRTSYTKSL